MSDRFSIPLDGDPVAALARARAAATAHGATLTGDERSGSFRVATPLGTVAGSWTGRPGAIDVTLSERPFLLSADRVARELRAFFAG